MTVLIAALVVALLLVADQLTKYLVLQNLTDGSIVTVIPDVLQFRYVENTGMAFSLLEGRSWLLGVITFLVCGTLFVYLVKGADLSLAKKASLLLVVAGGLGNCIDRLSRQYVVDFMEVLFTKFAVFNVADCFVTVGAIWLIILLLLDIAKEEKQGKEV